MKLAAKTISWLVVVASFTCFSGVGARADNLLANGDFQSGYTGFTTDYVYTGVDSLNAEGRYAVGSNVHTYRTDGAFDGVVAQSGAGTNFFMANGSPSTSDVVWQTQSLIQVTEPNTAYRFEAYLTTLYPINSASGAASPLLKFQLGDGTNWVDLGSTVEFPDGTGRGQWEIFYVDGNFSVAGNYYLRMVNDQPALGGNDFGLDSLYFGLATSAPSVDTNPVDEPPSFDTGGMTTAVPDIDTAKASYTITELLDNQVGRKFDGGTLLEDVGGRTLANGFIILPANGTIDTNGFDLAITGAISGEGRLTKSGTGTLTLSGTNTYSGGTILSAGRLVGNASSLQGDIVNDTDVEFDQTTDGTYAGAMSGSGTLTKTGRYGKLTLSGTNTYSGGTTVSAGTLAGNIVSLQGDIVNNAGVEFNQSGVGVYTGAISGSGTLTKTGSGTLVLSGTATYTGNTSVEAGGLVFNGTLASDFTVSAGAALGGNGTVGDLHNSGTVAPGNSIGTIIVTGDYTHDPSATYEVEINDSGQSDLLDISGTATINGGTVAMQAEPGAYTAGMTYTILEADGGVQGAFDAATGRITGLAPQLLYNANDVVLLLTPLYTDSTETPNQQAIAAVLQSAAVSSTGDLATVLDQLDLAVGSPGGEAYLDQLTGEVFGTTTSIAIEQTATVLETISRRVRTVRGFAADGGYRSPMAFAFNTSGDLDGAVVRCQSPSGSDPVSSAWCPWVQGYGLAGNAEGTTNTSAFRYDINGTTVAVDRPIDDRTCVGLVGGYGNTNIHLRDPSQRCYINSGQFAVYLQRFCCSRYTTGIFSYAHNDYDTARRLVFEGIDRTASADYHGDEFAVYLEHGRMFRLGSAQCQPYGALQYIGLHQSGATETGADSMNLAIDSDDVSSLRGILGARVVWYDRRVRTRVLAPELRAFWRHEFLNEKPIVGASFVGIPGSGFQVLGADLGRDAAVLGGGLTAYFSNQVSLFANYDVHVNNVEVAHVGTGGVQVLW